MVTILHVYSNSVNIVMRRLKKLLEDMNIENLPLNVINLFGGPGSGKSTTAAGLFHLMKLNEMNVELVTEYAKDLTWEERYGILANDQLYVFAKQQKRLQVLKNKVNYVVTDSPLVLSLIYRQWNYLPQNFEPLVFEVWNGFINKNYYIKRTKKYVAIGRTQTEDEALGVDEIVKHFLKTKSIEHDILEGDKTTPQKIYDDILVDLLKS